MDLQISPSSHHSVDNPRPSTAALSDAVQLLDTVESNLASGADVFAQMERFCSTLLELRNSLGPAWKPFAKESFHNHPLRRRLHASPFSRRSYEQPRGYPGDAGTLDYIYGIAPPGELDPFARRLFDWEYQTQGCRSVRERRLILANTIDEVAEMRPRARMLSVACGHLREAELTRVLAKSSDVDVFYALDQDTESLALVEEGWNDSPIRAVSGSVRSILTGKSDFAELDLVYAAGLYDYLDDAVAARLTAKMFSMLRSGGKLLVANFHTGLPGIGGMETMMRWWLIYRTEEEVALFSKEIDRGHIADQRVFRDIHGNVVYLELLRS